MIYKSLNTMLLSSILCMATFCPLNVNAISTQSNNNIVYENQSFNNYSISIPKSINLDENKIGEYEISVSGSIETYQEVYVNPIDSIESTSDIDFYMISDSDEKAKTIITQDKNIWDYQDVKNSNIAQGTISSNELKAGEWEGTFYFEFGINEITSSIENINIPIGGTSSFNIYYNGEDITSSAIYDIDNSNVTIKNGKISISNSATSDVVKVNISLPNKNLVKTITINIIDIDILKDGKSINSINITKGDTIELNAKISPSTINKNVTWTYKNVNATVNKNKLTINTSSMNSGTYTIKASYGGCNKTITLIVEEKQENNDIYPDTSNYTEEEKQILSIFETTLRNAGFSKTTDYMTKEEIEMFGPTDGMGWGQEKVSLSNAQYIADGLVDFMNTRGYTMFYIEVLGTSNGETTIIVYRG